MDQFKVRLILADKSLYPQVGVLELVDVAANQGTDSVTLRAQLPNPDGVLIDGMSVSVLPMTSG
jgi:membrane fusion protein (multidrug efflux system)